jgi:hypothetical protein
VARLVPDVVYPDMYRVEHGGTLSDMASLSRAKDAALSIVDREVEERRKPQRRPPVRQTKRGATWPRLPTAPGEAYGAPPVLSPQITEEGDELEEPSERPAEPERKRRSKDRSHKLTDSFRRSARARRR